jgi:DNA-binding transcriptional ArsR family regulator
LPELLDRVRAEIRERLERSRAAVEEYRQLEAALAALNSSSTGAPSRPRRRTPAQAGRAAAGRASGARKRAPRGANREAVLRVVGERPGITTSELAPASGVEKRTLYTLLSTLTKQGVLERQDLPGGQTGYRVRAADTAPAEAPAPAASGQGTPVADDTAG